MNPKDLKVTITAVPVDVPPMTLEEAQRLAAQGFGERTQDLYHAFDGGYVHPDQGAELKAFRLGMAMAVRVDERMRLALVWALGERPEAQHWYSIAAYQGPWPYRENGEVVWKWARPVGELTAWQTAKIADRLDGGPARLEPEVTP